MKNRQSNSSNVVVLGTTLCLMLAIPGIYRVTMVDDAPILWILPNLLSCALATIVLLCIRRYWVFTPLTLLAMFASGMESFLIVAYKDFIRCGNLLSTFGTNTRESSNFASNNVGNLMWVVPVLVLAIVVLVLRWKMPVFPWKQRLKWAAASLVILAATIVFGTAEQYPPFNFFVQGYTAIRQTAEKKLLIPEGDNMTFGAQRTDTTSSREIYVFGVGESLRYDHTSFAGYERNTTPELAANPNVVAYDNYFSTATLTLYSVPMMITRANVENFNLNFTEKSIVYPYHECGFKTFVISCKKFLSQQPYLSRGCDELISVSKDAEIPHVVDSLSAIYPKTFFIVQLFQCHSYYSNFTPEYDRFHPNLISDPGVEDKNLYLNAYDNAVLYTDHVMSELLKTIDKPNTRSSFIFASDHGEVLDIHGHRRGNNMTPPPAEYHVPMIFWSNEAWAESHPEAAQMVRDHRQQPVNGDILFYSALDMAGITLPEIYAHPELSVLSPKFKPYVRKFLLPDGRSTLDL